MLNKFEANCEYSNTIMLLMIPIVCYLVDRMKLGGKVYYKLLQSLWYKETNWVLGCLGLDFSVNNFFEV